MAGPLTFEQWVGSVPYVFVGTLLEVDDEVFVAGTIPRVEAAFRVEQTLKGSLTTGTDVVMLQSIGHVARSIDPAARLRVNEQRSQWLILASDLYRVRADDGSRSYPHALGLVMSASYMKVVVGKKAFGVRGFSPYAKDIAGYDGARQVIAHRLTEGMPLRAADARPWDELISRAIAPSADPAAQLGQDEVEFAAREEGRTYPAPEEPDGSDNWQEEQELFPEEFETREEPRSISSVDSETG